MRKAIAVITALSVCAIAMKVYSLQCHSVSNSDMYTSRPADVSLPEMKVIRTDSKKVEALMGTYPRRALFISNDDGRHWTRSRNTSISIDIVTASGSSRSRIVYATANDGRIFQKSDNGGSTWERVTASVDNFHNGVEEIKISILGVAQQGHVLFANIQLCKKASTSFASGASGDCQQASGVYISKDEGAHWHFFSSYLSINSPIASDPTNPDLLFGVTSDGVVKSVDGGNHWIQVGEQRQMQAPIELEGRRAALAKLLQSGRAVPAYLRRGISLQVYQIELTDHGVVILRTNRGLIISRDGGETWCISDLGGSVLDNISSLVIQNGDENVVLATTRASRNLPSALFVSRDGAKQFTRSYVMNPITSE